MVPVHPPRGENSKIVRVYTRNLRGNANHISNYAATKRWSVSVNICSPEGTDPTPIFSGFPNLLGPSNFVNSKKIRKKTPKRSQYSCRRALGAPGLWEPRGPRRPSYRLNGLAYQTKKKTFVTLKKIISTTNTVT